MTAKVGDIIEIVPCKSLPPAEPIYTAGNRYKVSKVEENKFFLDNSDHYVIRGEYKIISSGRLHSTGGNV